MLGSTRGMGWCGWGLMVMGLAASVARGAGATTRPEVERPASDLRFICSGFENASPVQWAVDADGTVQVYLPYDYERESPNRAAGHWYFQLHAKPGAELTVILNNFDNVWNGRAGSPVSAKTICYASAEGSKWEVIPMEYIEGNRLRIRVKMETDRLYLARLQPYRISDLEKLVNEIKGKANVAVVTIGKTVEGRELEIIRVGNPKAPHRVVLRARAHAWEPGGNWVVEGLIRALLREDAVSRKCLERYCVYVMPMANKDGVARGLTRFNMMGKDLNRNWDKPADPQLAPENHAFEQWLGKMVEQGQRPDLVIDLHNDEGGLLHLSRPPGDLEAYLARMAKLEQLLRRHTWFTEGSTKPTFRNPGSLGEGLLERFGITGCILELNGNWIAGLQQPASAKAWEQFGEGLREVFFEFVGE